MKIVSLLLIFFAAFIFSACAGHTWESPLKVVSALFYSDDLTSRLLTEWRLPRVITAGFTGALLGLSGAIFQGVFRNPLAEPWLLGSSGGAAIGGTVALLVPLGLPLAVSLPLFAFSGALAAIFIVLSVSPDCRFTGYRHIVINRGGGQCGIKCRPFVYDDGIIR